MQIQTNKVLAASVKLSLFFKSRDKEELLVKPIQFERWEPSLDSVVTVLPSQNLELSLSTGSIMTFIKLQSDGEDSNARRIIYRSHSQEACTCMSEYNIYSPGVNEEIRDVALMVQSVRKLPITRRQPQNMYNTCLLYTSPSPRD